MATRRILCVGNELCHDDGVALRVGNELESRLAAVDDVEVHYLAELGLSTLDAFLGANHVIVIDAVTTGHPPGTCTLSTNLPFAPKATCSIGHAVSLDSMLELVAALGPTDSAPRVTVVGIEAENLAPFGTTLSPPVLAAIPKAVELALDALDR
jgi:hydrogenase maturation protease